MNVLERQAIVYVRQSTTEQVERNLESQRSQYELADLARSYGFRDVVVVDEDLGRSGSGTVARPGFERLMAQVCQGNVGAVFSIEASRLARNGRDWHRLLELCGLMGTFVVDADGIYDPGQPNDRLLLGLKGTMSEFELTLIRRRMLEGTLAKVKRGELRLSVPIGYIWQREQSVELDPDRRVQDSIRNIFVLFDRLGSARQVLRHLSASGLLVPRSAIGKTRGSLEWGSPLYRNVIAVLRNPFYAGAYAYGKSQTRTGMIDGRVRKSYGHPLPVEQWAVLIRDHHEGYIDWQTFERNQHQLSRNAYGKAAGSAKSGRGGQALLSGILRCRRCARMLSVRYGGKRSAQARYSCHNSREMGGVDSCMSFSATRPGRLVAQLLLDAVQPMAVEAASKAYERTQQVRDERQRALELELEQARYEARLAQRRYEAVDPDNRNVAQELETRWNRALEFERECRRRCEEQVDEQQPIDAADLMRLAQDLDETWNSSATDMRTKQRLLRTLIEEVVVDVDEAANDVILTVHWKGGVHSEHRVSKPKTGHHERITPQRAAAVIRDMVSDWPDEQIAAVLNRMGLKTGQANTWNAERVRAFRRKNGLPSARRADASALTLQQAASRCSVSVYAIRKLVDTAVLPAHQVVTKAPWRILQRDLDRPEVQQALGAYRQGRPRRPRRPHDEDRNLTIPGT